MEYPVLGVNIDHVATVRQARGETYPDVVEAALVCEKCDIFCITAHLREDRRHIQDKDIYDLKNNLATKLNLEMSLADDIVEIAHDVKPYMVTLVPEKREEITTEGGLDVIKYYTQLQTIISDFKKAGIIVSLFIEPSEEATRMTRKLDADYVEYHTGSYANAATKEKIDNEINRLYKASDLADELGIKVNAGHGLTVQNVLSVTKMKKLRELNIGHSIISRSIFIGLENAVNEMITAIKK